MQDAALPLTSDDGTASPSTALVQWCDLLIEAFDKMGRSAKVGRLYKRMMEEAGFVDVVEVAYKWPMNTWPKHPEHKELGAWQLTNNLEGIQAWTMAPFTRMLGWSPAQVEIFLVEVRKDFKNRNIHAYWPVRIVYGRKPEH